MDIGLSWRLLAHNPFRSRYLQHKNCSLPEECGPDGARKHWCANDVHRKLDPVDVGVFAAREPGEVAQGENQAP